MRLLLALSACLLAVADARAGDPQDLAITGHIGLAEGLAISPGTRLVIRMYHPDEGVEKDLKYWILEDFALPQTFSVAPTVNMAGNARWDSYVIEAFTDRDRNVLNLVDGEFWAGTGTPLPVGTADVGLVLDHPPAD